MRIEKILELLNTRYPMAFSCVEQLRDMGSTSYAAYTENEKYFLRFVKPAFRDTAAAGVGVHVFLQERGFPVPPLIYTRDGQPYVHKDGGFLILYAFIEGEDCDPERDAEASAR